METNTIIASLTRAIDHAELALVSTDIHQVQAALIDLIRSSNTALLELADEHA
jgi:hypothetical protein